MLFTHENTKTVIDMNYVHAVERDHETVTIKFKDGETAFLACQTDYNAEGLEWCREFCESRFYAGPEWGATYFRLGGYHDPEWVTPAYMLDGVYFSAVKGAE